MVAFPTETVYGLGANALDPSAVRRIFAAKGRPADNPLIVHVADPEAIPPLVSDWPPAAQKLLQAFWPGPLSIIVPRSPLIPDQVTAGLDTVAIRMPSHPVAQAFIRACRLPIAAPSANLSGRPSPTTGIHVWNDLQGKIAAVVDGGPCQVGVESTVVDVTAPVPMILRPGGITREQLRAVLGEVDVDPVVVARAKYDQQFTPRSPGMKYKHYAPRAEVYLVEGPLEVVPKQILSLVGQYRQKHRSRAPIAVLASDETFSEYASAAATVRPDVLISLGSRERLEEVAASLFSALRTCDQRQAKVVFSETFPEDGVGLAIMNRLCKAAAFRIIKA